MKVVSIRLIQLLALFGVVSASTSEKLPRISFLELTSHDQRDNIRQALTNNGIMVIENIPGFKQIRRSVLSSIGGVISENRDTTATKILPDGTSRSTLGSEFSSGNARSPFSDRAANSNQDQRDALDSFQTSVDGVAEKLSAALDQTFKVQGSFFGDESYSTTSGRSGESWDSFNDLMHGGSYLEHLHSYSTDVDRADDTPSTLEFHTDAGLFILFAPALYTDDVYERLEKPADFRYKDSRSVEHAIIVVQSSGNAKEEASAVQREDGVVVHSVGPDSLIMMVGQGAAMYLNPQLVQSGNAALRAVPHSLTVTNAGQRNWYGRMYLPPTSAWLKEQHSTYADVRHALAQRAATASAGEKSHSMVAGMEDLALPLGCGLGMPYTPPSASLGEQQSGFAEGEENNVRYDHYLRAALPFGKTVMESCNAGELYCWAECMSLEPYNLTCPYNEITCVDTSGNPTDPTQHVPSNHPGCVGQAYADPGGFCQGQGVNMYMTGFVSYVTGKYRTDGGSTTPSCLVLWFEDWVLDSQGKFFAACFGVLLLGLFTEGLTQVRRKVRTATRSMGVPEQALAMGFMYAVQLMFGYFCMLIAMTYQVELFVCVVVGLGVGYVTFNFKPAPAAEKEPTITVSEEVVNDIVDPCCQYLHLEEDNNRRVTNNSSAGVGNVVRSVQANPM